MKTGFGGTYVCATELLGAGADLVYNRKNKKMYYRTYIHGDGYDMARAAAWLKKELADRHAPKDILVQRIWTHAAVAILVPEDRCADWLPVAVNLLTNYWMLHMQEAIHAAHNKFKEKVDNRFNKKEEE